MPEGGERSKQVNMARSSNTRGGRTWQQEPERHHGGFGPRRHDDGGVRDSPDDEADDAERPGHGNEREIRLQHELQQEASLLNEAAPNRQLLTGLHVLMVLPSNPFRYMALGNGTQSWKSEFEGGRCRS
jgi:hypothetical protein